MDSTALAVCQTCRMPAHKVVAGWATCGKTSMGWFYGCTLHLSVTEAGALLACQLTPGQGEDRQPVPPLTTALWGPLFGDRGDRSQALHDLRFAQGLTLLTTVRRHRQNRLMRFWDKRLLRKRALIEPMQEQ